MQAIRETCATSTNPARYLACLIQYRLDKIMKSPTWMTPVLSGAGLGALAVAIIGFGWGGWMTSSAAMQMSSRDSISAVAAALTPYCVQSSKVDPKSADVMTKLKEASPYQRRDIVEDAGWATPLGADRPHTALAQACQTELSKSS